MLKLMEHQTTARIYKVNCKGVASTSGLPFCVTVAQPDDGHNFRPKHVVENVMNKLIFHSFIILCYSENQQTNTDNENSALLIY